MLLTTLVHVGLVLSSQRAPLTRRPPRAVGARCVVDPFRGVRPPLEPMMINAIQDLLADASTASAGDVVAAALRARAADTDYTLTAEEEDLIERRVTQVSAANKPLVAMLEAAVAANPWVSQFGATASFGVGDVSDPYVRICRAECMLAALLLHVEGAAVEFLEEDRLEVLQDAPSAEMVEAVCRAVATAGST